MAKEFVTVRLPQSEMDKFTRWTQGLNIENKQKCRILIQSTIFHIQRLAKTLLQSGFKYSKGFLKSHIYTEFNADKLGGGVYTAVNYAPYIEWGTGKYVNVPSFVKDMFNVDSMEWKGKGIREVNREPHPYLFESARIGWNEMIAKLELMGFKKT